MKLGKFVPGHWPAQHVLTRRLSVVVNDWMEEVALISCNMVTICSILTQYIISVDNNKDRIIALY